MEIHKLKSLICRHKSRDIEISINTLPQAGVCMSYASRLLHRYVTLGSRSDLVKISASRSLEFINEVVISPEMIFSRMKWQSISICLVRSWETGLEVMCKTAWLSQMSFIEPTLQNFNSWNSCLNHISSHVVRVIAQYFASAFDLTITFCFLLFYEMRLLPIRT